MRTNEILKEMMQSLPSDAERKRVVSVIRRFFPDMTQGKRVGALEAWANPIIDEIGDPDKIGKTLCVAMISDLELFGPAV